eukprot:TRINITY_DN7856_c0_g1_i1.p1 TRINITY_DN7856_c0_g1~~TRINITY_DN7856_c0_g1_i1.p1  ORF type:complete len:272 (+),score=47.83 TRINITY_DN7856_c0_g1_i1:10-825(+)
MEAGGVGEPHELQFIHYQIDLGKVKVSLYRRREEKKERKEDGILPIKSTGSELWPSALVLCKFLAKNLHLIQDKTVLELGAGQGLVGLFAAYYASQTIITDKDEEVIDLIRKSIESNQDNNNSNNSQLESQVETSTNNKHNHKYNATALRLVYGDKTITSKIQGLPKTFDIILGSDIVYYSTAIPLIWDTIDSLLSREKQGDFTPTFILSYASRNKTVESAIAVKAKEHGFTSQIIGLRSFYSTSETIPTSEHVAQKDHRLILFVRESHLL